jgi:hypothetical protein
MQHKKLYYEIIEHAPFTAFASILAVAIVFTIFFFKQSLIPTISSSFETIHELHIIIAAIVSSALFYKYKKNIPLAMAVGLVSSIAIGSLSDVIFPYLGSTLLNLKPEFHLPLLESPITILAMALLGCILGIIFKISKFPHALHIFISTFASLLYITKYTISLTPIYFIGILIITFIAVIVPCCLGDIVLPILLNAKKEDCCCDCGHH